MDLRTRLRQIRLYRVRRLLDRLPDGAHVLDLGCGSALPVGPEVIRRAEDREIFRETVRLAGLKVPESTIVSSHEEGPAELSFPVILRPAFTLGGHGGGTARNWTEFIELLDRALHESPVGQVLVEESLLGWDEFELEVIRDRRDNVVIVCSIENLDPMGVHTGDSVTVAPQMTLADEEYQELRDTAELESGCIPAYTRDGFERVQKLRLTVAEAQFASQFNGQRSIAQIAKNLRLDFKFARLTLFRFLALEIVECWPPIVAAKPEKRGFFQKFGFGE